MSGEEKPGAPFAWDDRLLEGVGTLAGLVVSVDEGAEGWRAHASFRPFVVAPRGAPREDAKRAVEALVGDVVRAALASEREARPLRVLASPEVPHLTSPEDAARLFGGSPEGYRSLFSTPGTSLYVVGVDLAREGERDQTGEVSVDRSGEVLEGDALAGARLVLLSGLWNRWVREQAGPGRHYFGRYFDEGGVAVPPRLSALFPERPDLARGALDFTELLGAICSDGRVLLPPGTVLDRFVESTFPEKLRGWLWGYLSREVPS